MNRLLIDILLCPYTKGFETRGVDGDTSQSGYGLAGSLKGSSTARNQCDAPERFRATPEDGSEPSESHTKTLERQAQVRPLQCGSPDRGESTTDHGPVAPTEFEEYEEKNLARVDRVPELRAWGSTATNLDGSNQ